MTISRTEKPPGRASNRHPGPGVVVGVGDESHGPWTGSGRRQPGVEEGVVLRAATAGRGEGVVATRGFGVGETVMVGFLVGALAGNDSHATQVGPGRWARHGGLGPKVNHSCDPNCGVRLNPAAAFDVIARRAIRAGAEITFDYAMRNFIIDHFPVVCLCGAQGCRGLVTGWKDLPAARKANYGDLVAPYLRTMDNELAARALLLAAEDPCTPPTRRAHPAPRGGDPDTAG